MSLAEALMFSRHDPSDDHWDRLRHRLPGQAGGHGGVGNDTRLFVDVIRYLAKTGIAWADLPTAAGKPNRLWQRYNRWCARGAWERVAAELRDDDTEWLSAESSCVRAHPCAAGAEKKRRERRPSGRGVGPRVRRIRHRTARPGEPDGPPDGTPAHRRERGR